MTRRRSPPWRHGRHRPAAAESVPPASHRSAVVDEHGTLPMSGRPTAPRSPLRFRRRAPVNRAVWPFGTGKSRAGHADAYSRSARGDRLRRILVRYRPGQRQPASRPYRHPAVHRGKRGRGCRGGTIRGSAVPAARAGDAVRHNRDRKRRTRPSTEGGRCCRSEPGWRMSARTGYRAGVLPARSDRGPAGPDGCRRAPFLFSSAQYRFVRRKPTSYTGRAPAPYSEPVLALSWRRASKESSSKPVSPGRVHRTNRQPRL